MIPRGKREWKIGYIQSNFLLLRKLFAITLLFVLLVNTSGYYFIYEYFIDQADEQMVRQLDNVAYDESELIELKFQPPEVVAAWP